MPRATRLTFGHDRIDAKLETVTNVDQTVNSAADGSARDWSELARACFNYSTNSPGKHVTLPSEQVPFEDRDDTRRLSIVRTDVVWSWMHFDHEEPEKVGIHAIGTGDRLSVRAFILRSLRCSPFIAKVFKPVVFGYRDGLYRQHGFLQKSRRQLTIAVQHSA